LQVSQAKRLKELEAENAKLKRLVANLSLDNLVLKDFASGNFSTRSVRRQAADHALQKHGSTESRARRLAHQPLGTQPYRSTQRADEDKLTKRDHNTGWPVWSVWLSADHGAAGPCRMKGGKDRVERIWRREGPKVPQRQKPCGRLWFNDGFCVRLRTYSCQPHVEL
jgi:hypothetical protein